MPIQQVPNSMLALDGGVLAFRNRLVNGDMRIAQRAASVALTTTIAYGSADRWACFQSASPAGTAAVVTSSLPAGFSSALRLGRNSGSASTGIVGAVQVLETRESVPLQGRQVTLSFWARAGVNYSAAANIFNVYIGTGTGTDQSAATLGSWTGQAYPLNTTTTLTQTWTRYTFTVTIPAPATQAAVVLQYTPVGTAGADDNVYVTGVQLEQGGAATPFEYRPFGVELALAQRYYQQIGGRNSNEVAGTGWSVSTTAGIFVVTMRQTLRTNPVVTMSSPTDWLAGSATVAATLSAFTSSYSGPDIVELDITPTGTPAWVANASLVLRANNTLNARIRFDAEL